MGVDSTDDHEVTAIGAVRTVRLPELPVDAHLPARAAGHDDGCGHADERLDSDPRRPPPRVPPQENGLTHLEYERSRDRAEPPGAGKNEERKQDRDKERHGYRPRGRLRPTRTRRPDSCSGSRKRGKDAASREEPRVPAE